MTTSNNSGNNKLAQMPDGLWNSKYLKRQKPKFQVPSWNWKMLKPKMPELPNVVVRREDRDGTSVVVVEYPFRGERRTVEFEPEKFFKQTVKVIREIKSLMRD